MAAPANDTARVVRCRRPPNGNKLQNSHATRAWLLQTSSQNRGISDKTVTMRGYGSPADGLAKQGNKQQNSEAVTTADASQNNNNVQLSCAHQRPEH